MARELGEDDQMTTINTPADAQTIYADGCLFATQLGSTVRLQLIETIIGAVDSNDPGARVRYVLNLVMPAEGFTNMVQYLGNTSMMRSVVSKSDVE